MGDETHPPPVKGSGLFTGGEPARAARQEMQRRQIRQMRVKPGQAEGRVCRRVNRPMRCGAVDERAAMFHRSEDHRRARRVCVVSAGQAYVYKKSGRAWCG